MYLTFVLLSINLNKSVVMADVFKRHLKEKTQINAIPEPHDMCKNDIVMWDSKQNSIFLTAWNS